MEAVAHDAASHGAFLNHRRPARRPLHRGREDRPGGRHAARRRQPPPGRGRHPGLRALRARAPRAGHERYLPPGLPDAGRKSPRPRGSGLQDADGEAPAGAHLDRRGDDFVMEASRAKWWTTDLQKRQTGECLQLHGGDGFMLETGGGIAGSSRTSPAMPRWC